MSRTWTAAGAAVARLVGLGLLLLGFLLPAGLGAAESPPADRGSYRIGPRDVLSIRVYDEPDLTGSYPVSERGSIDFPLVGRLEVEGLTPAEVQQRLTEVLAEGYLVNPQVAVSVETYASRPVQVLGAVRQPGVVHLTGPTTLLDVLALAGGVVAEKSIQEVHVTRAGQDTPIVLNLEDLLTRGENNLEMLPGDRVYVPEGALVYVSGEVNKPGTVPYRDGMTLTQALTAAGGPTTRARLRQATVLRADGTRLTVNVKRILQGREPDLALQPGDQVFIEQSLF